MAEGIPYTVLPGPSAVLTALIGSGFPAESFYYGGFLPPKSGGRERELKRAANRIETSVFFESPHRLDRTLEACARLCPDRVVCVARELSKQFEEYRVGIGAELARHYTAHPPKGEIVFLMRAATKEERRAIVEQEESGADDASAE
jgi:16S rRNA (cytidine1402-2'-O)-methyltransferase